MEADKEFLDGISGLTEEQYEAVKKVIDTFNGCNPRKSESFISTEEAARKLGVTSATVRSYLLSGKLDGRRLSERKLVVSSESVDRMRNAQARF